MSGASEVPAIPEDVRLAVGTVVLPLVNMLTRAEADALFFSVINAIMSDRASRPVDTGREKALEAGWFWTWDKLPEPGRKFIAVYNDGSGARMFFALDDSVIDHEGDEYGGFTESFDRWAYLPDDCEFWCETRSEEPFTFPPRALANPENGRG